MAADLDGECERLVTNGVLPADLVTRNRQVAEAALRPWTPMFTHGDLQITHVFVDGDEITGIIDWSEAGPGDALFDLATLTLGHEEHLGDVVAGYGTDVDLDVIRAWWSLRSLLNVRWLVEHGFDPFAAGCEVDVLRSRDVRLRRPPSSGRWPRDHPEEMTCFVLATFRVALKVATGSLAATALKDGGPTCSLPR